MRTLELKIPPAVVLLLLGAVMYATARLAPVFGFVLPANRIIAAGVTLIGVIIALLGVASFRRAGTTVNPLQPEAASQLVVSGVYRWTRNPMYLGMLLVLLGWGVLLGNALAFLFAAAFIPLMNRLQIGPEERTLAATFGSAFTAYQSAVRRWL
jgi:protein-S-isoprenylcysteine O-methyltransferase Ste14